MPVITFASHPLDRDQKKKLISSLTDAAVQATGIPKDKFTILIQDHLADSIGIGGLTLEEIRKNN